MTFSFEEKYNYQWTMTAKEKKHITHKDVISREWSYKSSEFSVNKLVSNLLHSHVFLMLL